MTAGRLWNIAMATALTLLGLLVPATVGAGLYMAVSGDLWVGVVVVAVGFVVALAFLACVASVRWIPTS